MALPIHKRFPRLTTFIFLSLALVALIGTVSPVQLPVVAYKLSLISLAAVLAYWLDRALFPYARPDSYLVKDWRKGCVERDNAPDFAIVAEYHWAFIGACLRRAIVVLAVVIGVALGL